MTQEQLIKLVTTKVIEKIKENNKSNKTEIDSNQENIGSTIVSKIKEDELLDISDISTKNTISVDNPQDRQVIENLKRLTPARIGVGKSGPRLKTSTLIKLRADHAAARDSVFKDVDEEVLSRLGLFSVSTQCSSRNEHLTRPDLGRKFSKDNIDEIKSKCKNKPTVQIYLADGLSSTAVDANAENILPALIDGLNDFGIDVGTPFFVKYGRTPAMDVITEALDSTVTCVLLGERPGLASAESMSAYITYKGYVGIVESKRTVVSNIHKGGIPAVEAGAHIAQLISIMLERKASGVDLQL